jgi:hypothetical protein
MNAIVNLNSKYLSIFLASCLFSSSHAFAWQPKQSSDLSVQAIRSQKYLVPETSSVVAKAKPNIKPNEINLFSPIENDELMVNYRKPFLHADLEDVLAKSKISLAQINKIFNMPNAEISDYNVIANFSHGFAGYNAPFMRPTTAEDQSIFWYAIMPREVNIKNAGIQVEWFVEGIGNHMQLHFSLDKNILLLPENLESINSSQASADSNGTIDLKVEDRTQVGLIDIFGNNNQPVLIKGEMIYALMGLKAKHGPQEFSFVNGITGNLTIGLTMASSGHMETDQMSRGSFLEEYQLKLSQEELQRVLTYVFNQNTDENPTANLYNTVFQNCIKEVVKAVAYGIEFRDAKLVFDADQFNPYSVPNYLIKQGLIEANPQLLNTSFSGYKLVNQSRETPENKGAIKKVDIAMGLIKEEDLDTFVRQFAYAAAVNQWKQESINDYFKLMTSKLKTIKMIESFNINIFMNIDPEWKNNENKDQIIQMDWAIKGILLKILEANALAEAAKIRGSLAKLNLNKLKIPKLDIKIFQTYMDVLLYTTSVKQ